MTTYSIESKVIQKLIERIKTLSDVTKWIGTGDSARVYGAHISTIKDFIVPCVSCFILGDGFKMRDSGGIEQITVQIDLWFPTEGKDANTWDDVIESFTAIQNELHNNGHWDNTLGLKLLEMTLISKGPQLYEAETSLMHYNGRFRIKASL